MAYFNDTTRHAQPVNLVVRSSAIRINPGRRAAMKQHIAKALRRHSEWIRTIRVWLDDLNGPRGGVDRLCRIQVQLAVAGTMTVEARGLSLRTAVAGALGRAKEAIDRSLKRRRTKTRFSREIRGRKRDNVD